MAHKTLKGRRVAVLAADGFEKIELTVPVKALKKAGAEVDIVSLREGRIRGVNVHEPAGRVTVTHVIDDVSAAEYDALFIPGGLINPDLLRQSSKVRAFVRAFDVARKPIASICHGPWVLASSELLQGRTLTSWPGIRDDVVNAGATWLDEEVVRDGNLVTSRGPMDLGAFSEAVVEHFARTAPIASRPMPTLASSPQAKEPPQMMLTAMKWTPRPSFRTALGLGAIALGVVAAKRYRDAQT